MLGSKILTDNSIERLEIKFDGERYALVHTFKSGFPITKTIILNPDEFNGLFDFRDELIVTSERS